MLSALLCSAVAFSKKGSQECGGHHLIVTSSPESLELWMNKYLK
jgi:hypothetical protein